MPAGDGGWQVLGASVPGAGHVRGGQDCQDAHRWRALPGGVLVVAVADGAGSAPRSELGSTRETSWKFKVEGMSPATKMVAYLKKRSFSDGH